MKSNKEPMQERVLKPFSGWLMLLVGVVVVAGGIAMCVLGGQSDDSFAVVYVIAGAAVAVVGLFLLGGLKIIHPNEALVLTLFGKYYGSVKSDGFFWVNPFCAAYNPAAAAVGSRKLSLQALTLNNEMQKVNDEEGNPIEIGVVVIWRVVDTARAVFDVENFVQYISTQCDAAIRQVARQYPYDVSENGDEKSLRGSSVEIRDRRRHAAAPAGVCHHRGKAEDRRRRGQHGGDGAAQTERK